MRTLIGQLASLTSALQWRSSTHKSGPPQTREIRVIHSVSSAVIRVQTKLAASWRYQPRQTLQKTNQSFTRVDKIWRSL